MQEPKQLITPIVPADIGARARKHLKPERLLDLHAFAAGKGGACRGNGDVAIVAREGDLAITGSRVEAENVGLAAKQNILLQSAEQAAEQKERSKASSGEIGITIGTEAGIGVYVSASAARGKGNGEGTSHAETVIQGNKSVSFVSGNDTTLEGAQIIGEKVVGQVGGDLTIRSQQDSNDYKRKDQSGGIDVAVGIGGGSVSANYAQSKIDSNYTSVIEQSGIQAGSAGFQIDVAGHTQLDGGAIASTADPSQNFLSTGSLAYTDLKNEAAFKSTGISVSASGGTTGGGGSGSLMQQDDKASSTTKAGIADGTLIVKDGSGTDISRGVTELQQDGLKQIFDEQKLAEQAEMMQVAGEVGMTAAGDLASLMRERALSDLDAAQKSGNTDAEAEALARVKSWSESGTNKTLLHAITGAGIAALGGGDALDGALGAAGAEKVKSAMAHALVKSGIDYGSPEFDALMAAGSAVIGGILGGGTGANTALAGDQFNRKLHPDEIAWIDANAAQFAMEQGGIPIEEAKRRLIAEAAAQVDATTAQRLSEGKPLTDQVDQAALTFLTAVPVDFAWGRGFVEDDPNRFYDGNLFANELGNNPVAFREVYDALAQSGLKKETLQTLYHGELLNYGAAQRGEDGKLILEGLAATAVAGGTFGAGTVLLEGAALPWWVTTAGRSAGASSVLYLAGTGVGAGYESYKEDVPFSETFSSRFSWYGLGVSAGVGGVGGVYTQQMLTWAGLPTGLLPSLQTSGGVVIRANQMAAGGAVKQTLNAAGEDHSGSEESGGVP